MYRFILTGRNDTQGYYANVDTRYSLSNHVDFTEDYNNYMIDINSSTAGAGVYMFSEHAQLVPDQEVTINYETNYSASTNTNRASLEYKYPLNRFTDIWHSTETLEFNGLEINTEYKFSVPLTSRIGEFHFTLV